MTPRTPLSARWHWPIALFLTFLAVSPGRIISFDVAVRAAVARALWTHGSPFVDAGSPTADGLVTVAGRGATSFYGIGQSLSFIPFDWLGHRLARISHLPDQLRATVETMPIV